ncbi:hypothetical protein CMQ_7721 [Grosmannia clavigera kw1407]|uniref:Uncharacterized protein n=1 Tax=Grosmannia clavigera (strain kw1407 / UAMH 11150) TaxID=655863 RepID=F0XQF5_GROCL|nr:uncharacterized protein CMQ_7721 [Grosmannia clavigera kw1407]EFX00719.1 hypothetical protein CMQ_7721 [Grosmannia clavigera kw1407]
MPLTDALAGKPYAQLSAHVPNATTTPDGAFSCFGCGRDGGEKASPPGHRRARLLAKLKSPLRLFRHAEPAAEPSGISRLATVRAKAVRLAAALCLGKAAAATTSPDETTALAEEHVREQGRGATGDEDEDEVGAESENDHGRLYGDGNEDEDLEEKSFAYLPATFQSFNFLDDPQEEKLPFIAGHHRVVDSAQSIHYWTNRYLALYDCYVYAPPPDSDYEENSDAESEAESEVECNDGASDYHYYATTSLRLFRMLETFCITVEARESLYEFECHFAQHHSFLTPPFSGT